MKDQLIKKGKDLLDEQLQAYGLGGSASSVDGFFSLNDGINRYQLAIEGLSSALSVLNVRGREHLSEPWQYVIQFTAQQGLTMEQVLSAKAVFALAPDGVSSLSGMAGQLSNELMSAFNAFGGMFNDKVGSAFNSPVGGFSINSVSQITNNASNMVNKTGSSLSSLSSLGTSLGDVAGAFSGAGESRVWYGVVTSFSQLATSADEARYEITLSPRLALLENTVNSAIYQNQTVPQVVEAVLRSHELTGVDFRFELSETYPVKEYITQWQESDLTFIRRLLADSGIWFSFETHSKHSCDVVVFGDSEQQYLDGPTAAYRPPSGNNDNAVESVWDMSVSRKTVPQSVITQDYNYRNAQTGMKSEVNSAQKDRTTRGQQYLYGEHYRDKGEVIDSGNTQDDLLSQFNNQLPNDLNNISDFTGHISDLGVSSVADSANNVAQNVSGQAKSTVGESASEGADSVGQGAWYARLRHQRFMTEQVIIRGNTTLSHLAPGQILTVTDSPISEAASGILIVSVESQGDRQQAYVISFTGIPYDVMRPYRPERLAWPTISGTLPARVTSPDNDTYSYIDAQGRYRVKMDFDLNDSWRKGEESLWMRLAKPYAGETYGMHFPFIDGTEVALAFTEGNPDRPYIAHGMHDSRHPDLVTIANHKRNVIRTPANNKLRMDDERGKEHIKVATEYGKTQLNLGHLVNAEREQRGEGFELRTDEWGAIRAGKGVLLSSYLREKAQSNQLDISETIIHLENALGLARSFARQLDIAGIEPMDVEGQESFLNQSIKSFEQPTIVATSPAGISLSSAENIQQSTNADYIVAAQKNMTFSVLNHFIAAAKKSISLFASSLGIKLVAAKGKVGIEAHKDDIDIIANKNVNITSIGEEIVISANKKITLNCNGSYITLDGSKIEIGTLGDVVIKGASFSITESQEKKLPIKGFEQCTQLATKSAVDGNGLVPLG